MLKRCELCNAVYWDRWRNTPAVCPDCLLASRAVVCPVCLALHGAARDPAQLEFLPRLAAELEGATLRAGDDAGGYVRPARSAPRAVQLRNPFH
jgi:hypothetical protein